MFYFTVWNIKNEKITLNYTYVRVSGQFSEFHVNKYAKLRLFLQIQTW